MAKQVNIQKATPTILHAKKAPYSSVSNDVVAMIVNPDALAIWTYLQTRSIDWTVIGSFLQDRFSISRERYAKAMACLKSLGLLTYETARDPETGHMLGRRIVVHYEPNLRITDNSVDRQYGSPNVRLNDSYSIKDSLTELSEKEPMVANAPSAPTASKPAPMYRFAEFWKLYPNKKGKAAAEKAWAKLKVTDDLFNLIAKGLAAQVVSPGWTKDGGQFIPHPATWLNGRRWEDEVADCNTASRATASHHSGFSEKDYTEGLKQRDDGSYAL